MLENFIADGCRAVAESFNNTVMEEKDKMEAEGFSSARGYPLMPMNESAWSMVGRLIAFVITILLIFMFGQYFWNHHVTKLFSFAKKTDSVMDILGLYLFVRIVLP